MPTKNDLVLVAGIVAGMFVYNAVIKSFVDQVI